MTTETTTSGYSHTQKAPLCLILYGFALVWFALAWAVGSDPGYTIAVTVALVIALLAPFFHHLTIEDQGEVLAIRFGPLPLFRRTVQYADIDSVEVGRMLFVDGWGIHYSLRGGWVWSLWGRGCVVVHWKTVGVLRIGTDDAENLFGFLQFEGDSRGQEGKKGNREAGGFRSIAAKWHAEAQGIRSQAGRTGHGIGENAVLDQSNGQKARRIVRGP